MPRARDFLARFRPAGIPGAAAATGVPADRLAEAGAELEPLFAMLADTEAEIDRIRAAADQRIADGHQLAAEHATQLLAHARIRADTERADASARAQAESSRETSQHLAAAEAEAARIRQSSNEQLDAQVAEIVTAVRMRLGWLDGQ